MKEIVQIHAWYTEKRPLYEALSGKVQTIIEENLVQHKVIFHSVTSRAKSVQSFCEKAKNEKYQDPSKEIMDMAGIRVITYLENDVNKVSFLIKNLFAIIPQESVDKSQLLGNDKVGYRSLHYVAKFDEKRCELPEYKIFENLLFEIQIRSILQHAWAEIEHDRNYKFGGKLPSHLERRFYLLAGMLEVADNEFSAIAQEIDKYRLNVVSEVKKGDLHFEINTTSLREYYFRRFASSIKTRLLIANFSKNDRLSKVIVEELRLFGVSTIDELDKIIPSELEEYMNSIRGFHTNFAGLTRTVLMINNVERYFKDSWREHWTAVDMKGYKLLNKFKVNTEYMKNYIKFEHIDQPRE